MGQNLGLLNCLKFSEENWRREALSWEELLCDNVVGGMGLEVGEGSRERRHA